LRRKFSTSTAAASAKLSFMRQRLFGASFVLFCAFAFACGSSGGDDGSGGDGSSGSSGGASGGFGSSGASGTSGTSGDATCAASIANPQKAKVDIIFVIDNSGSMNEEMNQIKTNVNTFASKILGVGLDLRVIFIVARATSATQAGNVICVPPPLGGASCADNPPTFFHIPQSVASNNSFQLILSTYDSTNATLAWNKHLRLEATKIFVEVTDDESNMTHTAFDTALLAKAPAGMFGTATARKYIFHSIVSKPFADTPPTSAECGTADGPSVHYQNISLLTGGLIDEVCKTDYSGVLDKLAQNVVDKLGCELTYPTADAADPTKLVVRYTPANQPGQPLTQVTDASKCAGVADGWHYDDNAAPTRIILCPTMCNTANASTGSKIEALVGCKAPVPK
jgi:hypothetical protein